MSDRPPSEAESTPESPQPSHPPPREGVLLPLLIPLASLAVIALVLLGFSRVQLRTTHTGATVVALVAAVGIMAVGAFVASRKQVGNGALFSMVGGVAGVSMLAGGLALLVATPGGEEEGPQIPIVAIAAPVGAATDGYSTNKLELPAGVDFQIAFDNQDTQPHNVTIATDDPQQGGELLFEGPIVNGPVQTTYAVSALDPGKYFFFCEVHPATMTGTAVAVEGAGVEGGGEGGGPPSTTIVAQNTEFDIHEIDLPPGTESSVTLDNQDTGVPHNFAIYADDAYTQPLFQGETVTGPTSVPYTVPPLDPGTYFFRCDVHPIPAMEGTVVVAESGGGGPGEAGGTGGPEPPSASGSASSASAPPPG
jgi:plastocyanin